MSEIDIDALLSGRDGQDNEGGQNDDLDQNDDLENEGTEEGAEGSEEGTGDDAGSDDDSDGGDSGDDGESGDSDATGDSDSDDEDESGDDEGGDDSAGDDSADDDSGDDDVIIELDGEDISLDEFTQKYTEAAQKLNQIENNEFLKSFNEFVLNGGDPAEYLRVSTVDYTAKSDIDIARINFEREYEGLDPKVVDKLFQKEMLEKYKIDLTGEEEGFTEEDVEIGQALLKRDAEKVRQSLMSEQENFKIPEKDSGQAEEESDQPSEETQRWNESVDSHEGTQSILETGVIQIGDKDNPYNFEIKNPQAIVDSAKDQTEFFKSFLNDKGEINLNKWYRVQAYAMDPDGFEASLVDHGAAQGAEKIVKEKKNISSGGKNAPPQPAEEDEKIKILKAFRDQGKHF